MAAIAPITLTDGEATPVDHVFNPISTAPATFRENGATGVPQIGENELTMSIRGTTGNGSVNKARIQLRIPVLEEATGGTSSGYVAAPSVAYYLQANIELMLPSRCTLQQRKNLRTMLVDLLGEAQTVSLVDSLESPY